MTVRIVGYQASHARDICYANLVENSFFYSQADALVGQRHAYTVIYNNQPVISTGICELWSGVGEAWMIANKSISDRPLMFSRLIKTHLFRYMRNYDFRRVQANVRSDWSPAKRFARFCEMHEEGEMPGFGPEGGTYTRYARVI